MADTYRNAAARHVAHTPRPVNVLPPELANQIAAGEVVERPASVIKELVENSLDAGATRVEVTIEDGGRDLIRIEDDGCGMGREDALRALERHATSKLVSVDDLFNIGTLGFRGEAIPSIASVSRLELKTKPHGALEGTRIAIKGGMIEVVEDVGMAAGTSITVHDLFFNTPARLKFMKTSATEARYISEMMIRLGLSRPDVRLILRRDGQVKIDLPAVEDVRDRILAIMGREVYDHLYPTFEFPAVNGIVARGYFSKPGHQQRTPNNIYTFVNGRYVSDRTIRAAIQGAYGALMEKGRYPSVVLFLEVPFDMVDVNVHPAKIEVRFHDTNALYRAVYHAIADALATGPWVKREASSEARVYKLARPEDAAAPAPPFAPPGGQGAGAAAARAPAIDPSRLTPARFNYRDDAASTQTQVRLHDLSGAQQQGFSAQGLSPLVEPTQQARYLDASAPTAAPAPDPDAPVAAATGAPHEEAPAPDGAGYFSSLRVIGQFKRQYIVCEDASGLVVIDQHAAHERIGYERLRGIFASHHKESQPLLFPKRLELDTLRADTMGEHLDFFAKAGFEIEPFGGQSYAIKSVPAILQRANIEKILRDALDDLSYHGRSTRMDEAMDAILSRMACHSVVRGPTELTAQECYALFAQMDAIDFAANCPHGRPVYFRMPLLELEAAFDRR